MSRAAQGLRAWLLQRFTAIYLALYLVALIACLGLQGPFDYLQWRALMGAPWLGVGTALFMFALLLHVWVGVRDVLIDYIHPVWLRLAFMVITAVVLLASVLWVLRALALAAVAEAG